MAKARKVRDPYPDPETGKVRYGPERVEYCILYTGYRSRRGQPGTEHWTPKSTFYISEEDECCWL